MSCLERFPLCFLQPRESIALHHTPFDALLRTNCYLRHESANLLRWHTRFSFLSSSKAPPNITTNSLEAIINPTCSASHSRQSDATCSTPRTQYPKEQHSLLSHLSRCFSNRASPKPRALFADPKQLGTLRVMLKRHLKWTIVQLRVLRDERHAKLPCRPVLSLSQSVAPSPPVPLSPSPPLPHDTCSFGATSWS